MNRFTDEQLDFFLNAILNKAFSIKNLRRSPSSNNVASFITSYLENNNTHKHKEIREMLGTEFGGALKKILEEDYK